MKILQINCVYGHGSTGAITAAIHRALLANGHASLVLYGRGSVSGEAHTEKVCSELYAKANRLYSFLSGDRYGGCALSTRKIIRRIETEQPDLVHLQCINGNFVNISRLVAWLNRKQIPTVLTLHAEFMYTANCSHSVDCEKWRTGCGDCPRLREATRSIAPDHTRRAFRHMQRAFAGFGDRITVVSVSPWLRDRASASPILGGLRHTVIFNGVDTDVFFPHADAQRMEFAAPGEKLVLHVTAEFSDQVGHLKGGADVIEMARRFSGEPVRFLVAGKAHVSGLLPENLTLLGEIRDPARMAQLYSMADVTLLTSRRETFSMPVAESLCCGTPVVGYEAGAPEQIALPAWSCFAPWGDTDALERAVRKLLAVRRDCAPIAEAARMRYASGTMTDNYFEIYRSMLCT
jgi:glycosyltransferase involved in cell wall biosynthesis